MPLDLFSHLFLCHQALGDSSCIRESITTPSPSALSVPHYFFLPFLLNIGELYPRYFYSLINQIFGGTTD